MKKVYLLLVLFAFIAFSAVAAKPGFQVAEVKNPVTGEVKNTISVPAHAIEKAKGLYYLGAVYENGEKIEGYAIIKYKKDKAKSTASCGNGICEKGENSRKCPADCGGGGNEEPDTSSCYGFLAKGAKWKNVEDYMFNPANARGMDEVMLRSNLAQDIAKWESSASYDILGNEIADMVDGADTIAPDGKNEVYFANIEDNGAIGITIIWGIFGGSPKHRKLIEWDQVYDDTDFDWSLSGDASKMDFESIATHELGHSVGMGDLYESTCSEMSMYGYATEGETKKRSLEDGDIAGIRRLY